MYTEDEIPVTNNSTQKIKDQSQVPVAFLITSGCLAIKGILLLDTILLLNITDWAILKMSLKCDFWLLVIGQFL